MYICIYLQAKQTKRRLSVRVAKEFNAMGIMRNDLFTARTRKTRLKSHYYNIFLARVH